MTTETMKISDDLINEIMSTTTILNVKQEVDDEKQKRIELRKTQLKEKLQEMIDIYFNKKDERSIPNAIVKNIKLGNSDIYINFNREHFTNWHTFVKGGYKNAHPKKCVHLFLRYAVEEGYLPKHIHWNIWNNQSFTVVFTLYTKNDVKVNNEV